MSAVQLNPEEKQLYAYCLGLLKARDYSENELKIKAKTRGYSNSAIAVVLNWLKQQNLVSDRRLAENLLEYYKSNKGLVWLQQKMRHRAQADLRADLRRVPDCRACDLLPDDLVRARAADVPAAGLYGAGVRA